MRKFALVFASVVLALILSAPMAGAQGATTSTTVADSCQPTDQEATCNQASTPVGVGLVAVLFAVVMLAVAVTPKDSSPSAERFEERSEV